MENSQSISGPTDASNRRVLDASGIGCGRLSPPDPADDPGGISCSIPPSRSRTGSFHATAVDRGSSYPRVEVEESSFGHVEEVYDGSEPVLDPRLTSGLKINNVACNPSLYRRGNEGQTASQELYNSDEYASLAEAQLNDNRNEVSSEVESGPLTSGKLRPCHGADSHTDLYKSDMWPAHHGAATNVDVAPSDNMGSAATPFTGHATQPNFPAKTAYNGDPHQ